VAEPQPGRRTFGPVVLLGLGAAALSAVAGARAWQAVDRDSIDPTLAFAVGFADDAGLGEMPLAGALALVLLACWGVVLVTRGRVRRTVTWLALVAAAGLLATVVTAWFTLDEQFQDVAREADVAQIDASWTTWYWAALVGALLSLVAAAAAVRLVASWPEMGSRYDAPSARETSRPVDDGDESQALWKAIDEGHDPTD
jgi:uncharacterized membrane protein (TIGR02234 family)